MKAILEVDFKGQIKSLTTKSLVSGDLESRLVIHFLPTDEILSKINSLHRADSIVNIRLQEEQGEVNYD